MDRKLLTIALLLTASAPVHGQQNEAGKPAERASAVDARKDEPAPKAPGFWSRDPGYPDVYPYMTAGYTGIHYVGGAATMGDGTGGSGGIVATIPLKLIGRGGANFGVGAGALYTMVHGAARSVVGSYPKTVGPAPDLNGSIRSTAGTVSYVTEVRTTGGVSSLEAAEETIWSLQLANAHLQSPRLRRMRAEAGMGVGIVGNAPGYDSHHVTRYEAQSRRSYYQDTVTKEVWGDTGWSAPTPNRFSTDYEEVVTPSKRAALWPYAKVDVALGAQTGITATVSKTVVPGASGINGYTAMVGVRLFGSDGPPPTRR